MHVDDNETEVNLKVKPKLYKAGMSPATDKKHFRCDQCDEIFVSKAACEKHRGKTHGAAPDHQKRYICEICGASLAPGSIKDHKNRHAQERLFPCATCGKVFKSAPNRSRHMRTHTGEKPYACKLCDKRFTQRQNAQLHHRKYHGKAIVKRTERAV
ncbi:RB-associated KRAB zinc finger protein-like [Plutella xylostella]|uniref:RB-associated KRAB zinc finger protein-like n=1 Tax=Plutella xylostella TaxID=51655 RepID=UPI0020328A4A|nr:RB-associated KRAB zinc finger protein-like [Plutella xylostella]